MYFKIISLLLSLVTVHAFSMDNQAKQAILLRNHLRKTSTTIETFQKKPARFLSRNSPAVAYPHAMIELSPDKRFDIVERLQEKNSQSPFNNENSAIAKKLCSINNSFEDWLEENDLS